MGHAERWVTQNEGPRRSDRRTTAGRWPGGLPEPPPRPHLRRDDWLGALAVFLLVFFTTLPVALPFVFMDDVARAMRASNAVAVALLFLSGFGFGRVAGYRPWLTGLGMVVLGTILVAVTIALGG